MPLRVSDRPERLIPVVPNDVLLRLVESCNIAIDAKVRPVGWEYVQEVTPDRRIGVYIGKPDGTGFLYGEMHYADLPAAAFLKAYLAAAER